MHMHHFEQKSLKTSPSYSIVSRPLPTSTFINQKPLKTTPWSLYIKALVAMLHHTPKGWQKSVAKRGLQETTLQDKYELVRTVGYLEQIVCKSDRDDSIGNHLASRKGD